MNILEPKSMVNRIVSGYNASLGNKGFLQKRDRTDSKGRHVVYRNNLKLNEDLARADSWTVQQIDARTERLADKGDATIGTSVARPIGTSFRDSKR